MERRSHRTTSAATPPTANGMRQPHSVSSALGMAFCRTTRTSSASIWPPTSVTYWKLEKKPRRLEVAASDMYVALVPYSPPTEKPWITRMRTSRIRAHRPITSWVGSTAIAKEPADIMVTLSVSAALRPLRSA